VLRLTHWLGVSQARVRVSHFPHSATPVVCAVLCAGPVPPIRLGKRGCRPGRAPLRPCGARVTALTLYAIARSTVTIVAAAVGAFFAAVPVSRAESPAPATALLGNWVNVVRPSGNGAGYREPGIVRVVVRWRDHKLWVRVYGNCGPPPCDFGEVPASPLWANPGFSKPAKAVRATGFTVSYKTIVGTDWFFGRLEARRLVLTESTVYKSADDRADYYAIEQFVK
jgi:hypothetical protein